MNARFIYMKLIGFITSIIGFSYSLTSFFNFFEVIFENKIITKGINIWFSGIGILFPLFVFIFGVFFYFYADLNNNNNNKWINISIISSCIISLICIVSSFNLTFLFFNDLVELVHNSFGYVILIINILFIYGKYKYIY